MLKITKLCTNFVTKTTAIKRHVSLSAVCPIDQKWREDRGLPDNPNSFGPLTNLPDYTFLDGRPTPMGSNQRRRLIRQQEIAAKIVQLSAELDHAKTRHVRLQAEKEAKRQEILDGKLKPKGHLLLKKNQN